jgi:hypothetical protein
MQVMESRTGHKPPLPSTWLRRNVRLTYSDCYGHGLETSGALLDVCDLGPVLSIDGAKTLIAWERLALLELVED